MEYTTLISSGCSHTYGSGILNDNFIYNNKSFDKNDLLSNWDNLFQHPNLKSFFKPVNTLDELLNQLKNISYPSIIAKELGINQYYNLSVAGSGIKTQFRKVFSFIEKNKNKIDLSKTLFIYQLPSTTRVEIINTGKPTFGYHSFNFQNIDEEYDRSDVLAINYFKHHFDFDYSIAIYLQELLVFKKYVESYGIKFLCFHLGDGKNPSNTYFRYINDEIDIQNALNSFQPISYDFIEFPKLENLLNEIDIWNVNCNEPYGSPMTLVKDGFNNDGHYSPNGHKTLGKNLAYHISKIIK